MSGRKGFFAAWILFFSIIMLAFMAPMITDIIGAMIGEYASPVAFVMMIILPVMGFALLYKLVFV